MLTSGISVAEALPPDLLRRLEEVEDLPSLPEVLLRVLELCESDAVDVKPLARLIETDAALGAKIIGVVNSLAYGLPNRVTGLEQAIVLLGTEAIKSIAVCASLAEVFSTLGGSDKAGALELARVWRHSLRCALVARELARAIAYPNPDEAFLAGLIHDVGKYLLLVLFPAEYPRVLGRSQLNPELLLVEEVRLGALHTDLGAWLVRRWGLPGSLAQPMESHHEPFHRILDSSLLVRITSGANFLSSAAADREQFPHERVASLLGAPAEAVAEASGRAARELEETARSLGLSLLGAEVSEREQRQNRLEREARSLSKLLASLWSITRAVEEAQVLDAVFRTLASLFHLDSALYFAYDGATDTLRCTAFSKRSPPETLEGLVLSRALSKSVLADSSRLGAVRYAFDAPATIMDGEIRRILGTEGFVCFPLAARGSPVGLLVVGGGNGNGELLRKREKPLLLLAGEAALALQADRLRERELDRVRIERIAAAQLVADRVTHEIRSPLAAIKNSVGALLGSAEAPESRKILTSVSDEVDRIGRLLGGLSRLASPLEIELTEIDVAEVARGFLPALERIPTGTGITVTLEAQSSLPHVRGNVDSLKQILINLVRNAADAMTEGGRITVACERDPTEGARGVRIVVEDAGTGIPDRVKGRLFEPYVTTKGTGHRGLGLAVVHSLASRLGGSVRYEPVRPPGRGARFTVSLPSV